jgi:hypothetical protein
MKKGEKMKKSQHVVPNPASGWDIKKGGAQRATKHFDKKQDAVERARQISKNQKAELVIHKKDGTIERTDSHGRDPLPPKDKDTHR